LLGALCIRRFGALPPRYILDTMTAELPPWLRVIASVAELLRKLPPL